MTPQRILGLVLLIVGVILLVTGMNSSHSMADQLSNTFRGRFTDNTQWYIIGGAVTGAVGLSMLAFGSRGRDA
jgi:hypothetical protein